MEATKQQQVIGIIKGYLGDKGQIVCLSLTGGRGFNWNASNQDYDVHGFFVADHYWDSVHDGIEGLDINLWEFRHCIMDIEYQHLETFQNFCDPFYKHPKFDYEGWMSFCKLDGVKQKEADIISQINRFRFDKSPRTGLHAYRIPLICIHFIETRKIVRDIFQLNKLYGVEEVEKLKHVYSTRTGTFDYDKAITELEQLVALYKEKISSVEIDKPDMKLAREWYERVRRAMMGGET